MTPFTEDRYLFSLHLFSEEFMDHFWVNGVEREFDELDVMVVEHRRFGKPSPLSASPQQLFATPSFTELPPMRKLRQIVYNRGQCIRETACYFCRNNGEAAFICQSHSLKDEYDIVFCPILREYVFPNCIATGDQAHTTKHCPKIRRVCRWAICGRRGRAREGVTRWTPAAATSQSRPSQRLRPSALSSKDLNSPRSICCHPAVYFSSWFLPEPSGNWEEGIFARRIVSFLVCKSFKVWKSVKIMLNRNQKVGDLKRHTSPWNHSSNLFGCRTTCKSSARKTGSITAGVDKHHTLLFKCSCVEKDYHGIILLKHQNSSQRPPVCYLLSCICLKKAAGRNGQILCQDFYCSFRSTLQLRPIYNMVSISLLCCSRSLIIAWLF